MSSCIFRFLSKFGMATLAMSTLAQQTGRIVGDPEALLGPKSSARGASTTGSHLVHDSLFQNPAAAALEKSYTVTVGYSGIGDQLSASIVDTKSNAMGGGIYYLRRDLRDLSGSPVAVGNYKRVEDRAGLSFFGMVDNDIAFGILGKYTYQRSFDNLSTNSKNWNGDAGAKYIFSNRIQLGLAAQNILKDDSGMNLRAFSFGIETLPLRSLNLSARVIRFMRPSSEAQFQLPNSNKLLGYAVGTEYALYRGLSLRAGYKDQPTWDEKIASAGLGYNSKEWGADYSFQMATSGTKASAHMATLFGKF